MTGDLAAMLCAAAALLLLASGVAKLARPDATARALRELLADAPWSRPRPRRRAAARLLGAVELLIAVAVLAFGGLPAALLLALAYAGFAVVAWRLVTGAAGGTRSSCGCFGRDDAPVSWTHVVVDAVATAAAVVAAATGLPAAGGLLEGSAATVLAGAALVVLLATTAYLSITALPALAAARRLVQQPS